MTARHVGIAALLVGMTLGVRVRAEPRAITPAPIEAALVVAPPGDITTMAVRLAGWNIRVGDGVLLIDDIDGDGRPFVGQVERRGTDLWLVTAIGALRLDGPLARPRIAGPGYRVWVVGHRDGATLRAWRIGVIASATRSDN